MFAHRFVIAAVEHFPIQHHVVLVGFGIAFAIGSPVAFLALDATLLFTGHKSVEGLAVQAVGAVDLFGLRFELLDGGLIH